ncbi:hypothetical protein LUQ84_003043 [Hamiltosporidium tvaerminnensis]|nr:hypothetical protein LUQ84_003043 [Hamiltosporidium tvaerminnensis]
MPRELGEASMGVIEIRDAEEPIPPLKEAKTEEDGAKNLNQNIKPPLFTRRNHRGTTNNINEESDLEEETKVVKEVEENM